MNYTDEKQEISKENRFIIQVMIMYIEDYEFLYECMGYDTKNIILDVEDLIVELIDLQKDDVYYCPLTIA